MKPGRQCVERGNDVMRRLKTDEMKYEDLVKKDENSMREIIIEAGNIKIRASLLDTKTAKSIWDALPITATVKTWGEEIYFDIPVSCVSEPDARDVVQAGELAYWPDGRAIAIGFGPTPISKDGEIRLVSPVNIWAQTNDDVSQLLTVKAGDPVSVSKI